MTDLTAAIDWEQPTVTVYGRRHPTPRLTAWFGDQPYSYSGTTHQPTTWPAALIAMLAHLEAELGPAFDSCLANLYRNGADSMGAHSDDELELGEAPTIASVSLGDRRRFVLAHVDSGRRYEWSLGRGDLLVMSGDSQSAYRHHVPKTARAVETRLNLTFRAFCGRSETPRSSG